MMKKKSILTFGNAQSVHKQIQSRHMMQKNILCGDGNIRSFGILLKPEFRCKISYHDNEMKIYRQIDNISTNFNI